MTNNNWITPEWIDKKYEEWASGVECKYDSCTICKKSGETQSCETYNDFFANEINKKIQNILESAEKRDCKECAWWHELNQWCSEGECEKYTKPSHPNWTPKEVK